MNKSKANYGTLSDATADLYKRGYVTDFEVNKNYLIDRKTKTQYDPEKLIIKEVYRFEGMTNPDDNSVIYAIESKTAEVKGVIINAYGTYANDKIDKLIKKIEFVEED